MRVLVTGHKGYIGAVLVPMLLKSGYEVVGLDSGYFDDCLYVDGEIEIPYIKKDVRDVELSDVKGFDAVMHLAGLSNDPMGDFNPDVTYDINYRATVNLAKLAKQAGVRRFLFSSSCSTYGSAGNDFIDETAGFNPQTPYGDSKVLAERGLLELADDTFSPTFLRNATAYGMSPRIRFDLVLNNLVAWAVTTRKVYLKSDGTAWRPIVHIADISSAFIALMEAPLDVVHCKAYNVGQTSENYRVRDIATIVGEVVPDCEVAFADGASVDSRNYRVNCDLIQKEVPGFKPVWTARKAAKEIYEAVVRQGLKLEEFEGDKFMRLARLKKHIADGLMDSELRWKVAGVAHGL
ncbi:MAG: SDR family oxidoreductase [Verrucomicrobia bacterium]|nr:SDR family oxidoreductase [Verrucomicrobiota bacterium]